MSSTLDVRADLDRDPWDDVALGDIVHGQVLRVGLVRHATTGGRAGVALLIRCEDGATVVAETTFRLARQAAQVLGASPVASEEV